MNLTQAQTEQLVSQIVTRLAERERRVHALLLPQLRAGLEPWVFVRHATLHLMLPDLAFIHRLAQFDATCPAVAALNEAWSWGMKVHISLHRQLLPALPTAALRPLPLTFSDSQGLAVRLHTGKVLSYRDIATLDPGWLLIASSTLVTPLAQETLSARHIQLLRQE
ncbi:TPA: microcompartment protein PduM [Yersinia enterocolitica]|uniref:Propanediol utilization protein n=1 Tax=Yersinia enterocolitica TaxID=630 RepID=A0ABM9RWF3_YEREN|nr:microcompartment protein PduM [Yersinia enterocolitica]AOF18708.1 microcompartment protein PduM [Yersinia enterocolitica]AOF23239.1 microcompartment protein PduM [Yersinia enterocolitica]AOF26948.1 microcompartment protein PduM [Yersinia enterocolitica]AOF31062.1 microcompartment protein PduM [Yersinia enterocolitica]AOF34981.1 microcompartment protein PduM [Yersinia enterocolitica]